MLAYLPGTASDSVAIGNLGPDNPMYLDPGLATVVLVAWLIVFVGAARVVLNRRDV